MIKLRSKQNRKLINNPNIHLYDEKIFDEGIIGFADFNFFAQNDN